MATAPVRPVPGVKVMIVDDSAILRQVLSSVLSADPRLTVMATANDPIMAMQRMANEWPDVIVLDVEMPRMDGITFLRKLMAERPTPVVICSTLTEKGAATTMQALQAGAVAFMTKPTLGLRDFVEQQGPEFRRVVLDAARAKPGRAAAAAALAPAPQGAAAAPTSHVGVAAAPAPGAMLRTTDRIIAVGASTGGTQALQNVLARLPRMCPGIIVVQHMPEKFTALLAKQLQDACQMEVREAKHRDRVLPGLVLIAPGGNHMRLMRHGAQYMVEVFDAPPVNRHRPSVDVLFRSVAQVAGANAMGIMLTGMGADGARGMLAMHEAGCFNVAQDEASSVVWGMPGEAVALGAVHEVLPLDKIAAELMDFARREPAH